ncbi:hypothetical protein DW944_08185 [Eubacterium ventriosum]|uniref:Uncharacterized protein n=1 Tax=Eubacterium ventriosum TaxID=39496 RepID=A0A413R7G5_9FIRM|nr:hypothetical protein DW944_08185 [Eubacterium ventriosum]RHB15646.1 hypothetical protein DW893_10570 [Eubacterium ventriosum]
MTKKFKRKILTAIHKFFVESLSDIDRVIFVKRYFFLQTTTEISNEIGKSKNYITVHLHRVRAQLKKYLAEK